MYLIVKQIFGYAIPICNFYLHFSEAGLPMDQLYNSSGGSSFGQASECPLCVNSGRQAHLGEAFVCNIRGGLIGKIFEVFRQLFLLWLLVLATPWGELPFREAIWPLL